MTDTYFSSDSHFFHRNILRFCPKTRPFETVGEMNEAIIEAWNGRVKPGDTIYHLGDFSFGNKLETIEIMERLNGQIHMVMGNHDHKFSKNFGKYLASCSYYKTLPAKRFGVPIVLFHFPIEAWNRMHHNSVHLHGHTHSNTSFGRSKEVKNRMDVGIDSRFDCAPWSWEEIKEKLNVYT